MLKLFTYSNFQFQGRLMILIGVFKCSKPSTFQNYETKKLRELYSIHNGTIFKFENRIQAVGIQTIQEVIVILQALWYFHIAISTSDIRKSFLKKKSKLLFAITVDNLVQVDFFCKIFQPKSSPVIAESKKLPSFLALDRTNYPAVSYDNAKTTSFWRFRIFYTFLSQKLETHRLS